ncbi:DNA-J related domain-containing protein [Pseudoalteromonas luteoviolacea]|uniref:DNA-J related domain-containing protein n=1 Tax=Pseudoalteromonas luteoviolacea TaxID=43657 RepID=UPI001154F2B9|nr:DNA-J related domain-containing protein [Pseudoalteromonas luteoviolacea]TQF72710.1 molecular chaperone DnaJ [Pseudoalteromonas luteoviolacea]
MFTGRTMINPILNIIFDVISATPHLKVHELAAHLKAQSALPELDKDPHKDLFKRNFIIMNGLYQLQNELRDSHCDVHISALDIYITDLNTKRESSQLNLRNTLQESDPLKSYYLDWGNYDTSAEEVELLLSQFWQSYLTNSNNLVSQQTQIELIEKWQLPSKYDLYTLQKTWRKLALSCHPDKGGCAADFNQIKREYAQLKALL